MVYKGKERRDGMLRLRSARNEWRYVINNVIVLTKDAFGFLGC